MVNLTDLLKIPEKRYRWFIFATLSLIYFFVYFHRVSSAVISKDLMFEFGVSALSMGLLSSMYFYSYALFQIPVGMLSDTVGTRKTTTLLTFVAASGSFLFGLSLNFEMALVSRLLIGIGVSGVWIPTLKILSQWYGKREYATLTGILLAVGNLGALSASYPLALMIQTFGWRFSFYLIGIITIFLASLCWTIVRDRPENPLNLTNNLTESEHTDKNGFKGYFKLILKNKDVWLLSFWLFVSYGAILGFQGLWGYPYLRDVFNLTGSDAGLILMLVSIGMLVGSPIVGIVSDRVLKSRKRVLIIWTAGFLLSWFPLAFFAGDVRFELLYSLSFLMGFFGCGTVLAFTIVKELFPLEMTGTATSVVNIFPFIGGAAFQTIMGYLIDLIGGKGGVYPVEAYALAFKFAFFLILFALISSVFVRETFDG
jgi:sugar phosphate permease